MPLSTRGRPSEADAHRVINSAIDEGMTLIDTADAYCVDERDAGHNERLIAAALRRRSDGASVRVATKGGYRRPGGDWKVDASPKHLRDACERSLRALGVDRIFLYQLHAPDPAIPFERSMDTLAALKNEGKIEHVGLSNVDVDQIGAAQEIVEIASVQNRLNPYFREAVEEGVVKECESRGITFLAYSPVGGGRLARKIPSFPVLQQLAARYNCSPHAVVLAWVRAQGKTVLPIPGASRVESAVDSALSATLTLSEDDLQTISRSEFSRA